MTPSSPQLAAPTGAPTPIRIDRGQYVPGVCNIGPAEIATRRRTGHAGVIAAVGLLVVLIAIGAPPVARLLIALPVMVGASGYLQAWLRFCAGFGSAGVFNFGERGTTQAVIDPEARRKDRAKAFRIGLAAFAIGAAASVVAVLLPI
jgi:hypothetical protein